MSLLVTSNGVVCLSEDNMANDLAANPYYFTETGSVDKKMKITAILWSSSGGTNLDIATDDDFVLQDSNGNVIASKRAESAGDGLTLSFGFPGLWVDGISVTTMDGGVCHVYEAK